MQCARQYLTLQSQRLGPGFSFEVGDVSACGRYLSVLYADRLGVYNRQLQAYATLHGPEHTREVLTRADGSVLMIGADSAELFLP